MKTKLSALIILLALALSSFAAKVDSSPESKELLKLSFKSSGVVTLTYSALAKSYPRVYILDAKKNVVFAETITNNYGVLRTYNISSLPEGEYFFEVNDNGIKSIQSIIYKKEIVNTSNSLAIDVIPTQEGKFNLICKGVDNKPVYVSIYSKTAGVIYEDVIDYKKDFSRVYDLSKITDKNLIFQVSNESNQVSKEVALESTELSLSK